MALQVGEEVWIPCEVVRGYFRDERNIRLDAPDGAWAGFVDPKLLHDDIDEGKTSIRATIVGIKEGQVMARLPGQTDHTRYLTCPTHWIRALLTT